MITAHTKTILIKMRLGWWANTFECLIIIDKSFKAVLASKRHIIIMMIIRALDASLLCHIPIVRPATRQTSRIFAKVWLLWRTNTFWWDIIKYLSIGASYTFSVIGIPILSFWTGNTCIIVQNIWQFLRAYTTSELIVILKIIWTRSTFVSLTIPEIGCCAGYTLSFLIKERKLFRATARFSSWIVNCWADTSNTLKSLIIPEWIGLTSHTSSCCIDVGSLWRTDAWESITVEYISFRAAYKACIICGMLMNF